MAKSQKQAKKSNSSNLHRLFDEIATPPEEKIARILALRQIRGMSSGDQIIFLRSVGFSTQETAKLLLISDNQVSVSVNKAKNALKERVKPKYLLAKSDAEV